jgi:aspartyl protease family protein
MGGRLRLPNGARPIASRNVWYAAFWLSLATVAYLAVDTLVSPKVARPVVTDGRGTVVIERSRDQHFYVEGAINGHPVTFLVDTGATLVSVSHELAGKIGLSAGSPAIFDTANGRAIGRTVPEASVRVGGIRVDGIRVGVGGSEHALLGQNFLNKVELMQSADRMILRTIATQ